MKPRLSLFSLLFFLAFSTGLQAQIASATVFSEDGDPFYLIVNGIRQNADAATNVKISDLAANEGARYKLKIIFEDDAKGEIDKNLYPQAGMDMVMAIRYKAKKDQYVLRMSALNELPYEPAPIVYHTEPLPAQTTTINTDMGMNTNVVVTETQTTTTTVGEPMGESESISVNMNVGGINVGGSVTVNESYSSTTTTTTTTSSGSMGGDVVIVEEPVEQVVYVPGYSGPVGCPVPMGQLDFDDAKRSISAKSFEDSKLTIAKQITKSNCLTASQVREIMTTFDFEDTKLEFAKFAWDYTYDRGNFYKVNDAFDFESSIEELDRYTSGR